MGHVALYRKYRSKTFGDVCGQDHITSVLKYQSATGRVSHAYLFTGSRGTGKTSCAKILAKAVNCENPKDGEPCGVCESCRMIDRGAATDVVEMDAASETGVEYIRSIKEEVQYPPALLKKRVYIIDEVHMLSESAFNALLKTLEEPPEHVIFILATTELHKLPATVISRCQRFDFHRLPVDVITARLRYIADAEGIVLDDAAAAIIAKQARGGMRDAVSLLDLCSGGGADVTTERVKEILGVSGYETVSKCADAIANRDVATLFDIVAAVASSSKDISVFWRELTLFFRDMLVCKYSHDPRAYLDLTESDYELLKSSSDKYKLGKLFYGAKILDDAYRDMTRQPETKRVTAEFALVRLTDEITDPSNEALAARIEALESAVFGGENVVRAAKPAQAPAPKPEKTETETARDTRENVPAAAPGTRAAYDGRFARIPDMNALGEKIGKRDFMAKTLLTECQGYVRDDGQVIRIVTKNPFVETYFTDERREMISDAAVECGFNDRRGAIEIVLKEDGDPLYEELASKIDESL